MASSMENREQALENKFAHDKNLEFRVNSKRNRILGQWAAEIMEMNDYQSKEYVNKLISEGINFVDDSQIVDLVFEDFQKAFVKIDREQVCKQAVLFKGQAFKEVMN